MQREMEKSLFFDTLEEDNKQEGKENTYKLHENGCYFLQIFLPQQQQSSIFIFIIKGCYKILRKNAKNRIEIYENRWFNHRI